MNKTTITLLFLIVNLIFLEAQEAKQGFDNSKDDTWAYTSNIPFYSANNNTDVWGKQPGSNGRIPGPFSGTDYLAARDLDNTYTEEYTGNASPEHILTFDPVDINELSAEISFKIQYIGIDKGDYIYFELLYDDNTNWDLADYKQDVFKTSQNGNFNSVGWQEVNFTVPTGKNKVSMRLVVYQNGNEYLGFDSFNIQTSTLSTKNNLIEGFSFGPNPTRNYINLKANIVLDRVSIYNVLGKEVLSKSIQSMEKTLDLQSLSSGIYITRVVAGAKSQTFKIIKR